MVTGRKFFWDSGRCDHGGGWGARSRLKVSRYWELVLGNGDGLGVRV